MSSCCSYSTACYTGDIPPRKNHPRERKNYHWDIFIFPWDNFPFPRDIFVRLNFESFFPQNAPSELAIITAKTVAVIPQYSQSRSRAKSSSDITTRIIGVKINANTPS